MFPLPARIQETCASRVFLFERFDLVETVLTPGGPGLARAIKPGRERRGLGEDMMWLHVEERKGTLAGIGLDYGLYAQVCPIYHE